MIAADKDALLCDMAQTYQIYDLRAVPVSTLARLACGLREDSRIRMSLSGTRLTVTETLLAGIVDRLGQLVWMQSVDGQKGRNRPKSILELLQGKSSEEKQSTILAFDTPEEFEAALKAARTGGEPHGDGTG